MQQLLASLTPAEDEIPEEFRVGLPLRQDYYLVGGELRHWDGPLQEVLSPVQVRTEYGAARKRVGEAPLLTAEAAVDAVNAAVRAYDHGLGVWPALPVAERIRRVEELGVALKERRREIVKLLMWEIGKTVAEAGQEVDRAIAYLRDTVAALRDLDRLSSRPVTGDGILGQVRRAPLGVVLCLGPYNFPLYETFTTLVPALVMGNTVIIKPPRFGILLFAPLLEPFRDCFPPGVINVVYGDGATMLPPLLATGRVDVLGFVGTRNTAEALKAAHPRPHRLRCVLGLDAKNPAIILPDADLDLATTECLKGALGFNGQRCTALKIIFVHRNIADDFLERMTRGMSRLKCGLPWQDAVTLTALPEPEKPEYLDALLNDASEKGARVVNPGGGAGDGSFFYPALLYPVTPAMRLYHEEQFGPVIPVVPYDDLREPIRYAVESPYGQQASIFGRDGAAMAGLVDALAHQVCRININSKCQRGPDSFPFNSRTSASEGTPSVADALRVFSVRVVVATRETEENRGILAELEDGNSNLLSSSSIT